MTSKLVVVIGVGAVGSQVARELAHYGIGQLRLIDPDVFTIANSPRHALPVQYAEDAIPWNKAEGMAVYLETQTRGRLQPQAIRRKVDGSVLDDELDHWLADADLIVTATDEREAQRRIGRRALALDIPAVFPGLYEGHGGEVFIQRSPRRPCFFCWDGWRPADQAVRGAAAGNADILDVIALTTKLCLGILDQTGSYARRFLVAGAGESQPPQLFVINDHVTARRPVPRRPVCPSCGVGPAPGGNRIPIGRPPATPPHTIESLSPASVPGDWPASRNLVAALGVFALLVVFVLALAESGGSSDQLGTTSSSANPTPTTAESSPTTSAATPPTTTEQSPPTTTTNESPTSTTPTTTSPTTPTTESCGTPAQCVEAGANAAAGEPTPTATKPTSPSDPSASAASKPPQHEQTGMTVATAKGIALGVQETGDSGTAPYGEGSCGPEQGQFWKVSLQEGDVVTIVWGGPNNSATGLDIWPPGTGEVHGSGDGRVTYASTEGEDTKTTFTAPSTGVYPIVIDDSCGQPGTFRFTLTTSRGAPG